MIFTQLIRLDIEVGSIHVSTNSMHGLGVKRNDLVQITNLDNGSIAYLAIKGDRSLRKDVAAMSYDSAVSLRIATIRDTYSKSNTAKVATVNLDIKKPSVVRYLIESVKTGNSISRWLATIGIFSGIDLLISLTQQAIKLISFLVEKLS